MLFSLAMLPIGSGASVTAPVADVINEVDRAGLRYEVTGMDTVIEGEWEDVIPVIRRAERLLRERHERVFMVLMMDDHAGAQNRLREAVSDVERALGRPVAAVNH